MFFLNITSFLRIVFQRVVDTIGIGLDTIGLYDFGSFKGFYGFPELLPL